MKKFKYQKQIEKLKDSDFLEGYFDSWSIWIQESEFSLPKKYMGIGFESEEGANTEMERIKNQYSKCGKGIFHIEIRKSKIRKLKKPISVS